MLDLLGTGHCAVSKPNQRAMQQSEKLIPCLEPGEQTARVRLLESFLQKQGVCARLVPRPPQRTDQDVGRSETVHAEPSLREVHGEKASGESREDTGRAQGAPEVSHSRWRKRESETEIEMERKMSSLHLLLRVGVKGVAENRWPTFSRRQTPAARPPWIEWGKKRQDEV